MGPSEEPLFTPQGGGLGVFLTCNSTSGTSSRQALPSPMQGSVFAINNLSADPVFLAFGDSSIVATLSYSVYQPGTTYIGIANSRGGGSPTHVAGITQTNTVYVQITAGDNI